MESVPTLTKEMLKNSRIIAKGRGIRDVQRLVDTYGGKTKNWAKKSTAPLIIDDELVEIHWYECHGIGRVELKTKAI